MRNKNYWVSELKLRSCPLCGSDNNQIISRKMKDGINLPTVICKNCSLVYTNPVPSEELYNRFYKEVYNNYYIHQDKFTPSVKGIPVYAEKTIRIINDLLPDTDSEILEIGSGSGSLLYYLAKQYPKAIGIEPGSNPEFARQIYRLNIIDDFFERHDFGNQKFEMIIMIHVLEHFYDINFAVSKCRDLLKEKGLLFVEVPDILKPFKSPDHYFLRYVHPVNFSPDTIKTFLAKHGFQTIRISSSASKGLSPKNIILIAQKAETEVKISLTDKERYKYIIRNLRLKRIQWLIYGWLYFKIVGLFRKIKNRIARSKTGSIIKKMLLRQPSD